jgi:hypothetical protein
VESTDAPTAGVGPLPPLRRICPGPSELRPPPDCQMPPPTPSGVFVHRVVIFPEVETPTTQPW